MNKQHIQFNMENPEADSQKGRPTNSAIFLLNNTQLDICIKENHYRLERDEEAFIKSLRDNMGTQAKMTQFLNTKTGSDGMDRTAGNQKSLDDIMKKKKVPTNHMNPKTLYNSTVSFVDQLNLAQAQPNGEYADFELVLDENLTLTGRIRLIHDEFSKIPRG